MCSLPSGGILLRDEEYDDGWAAYLSPPLSPTLQSYLFLVSRYSMYPLCHNFSFVNYLPSYVLSNLEVVLSVMKSVTTVELLIYLLLHLRSTFLYFLFPGAPCILYVIISILSTICPLVFSQFWRYFCPSWSTSCLFISFTYAPHLPISCSRVPMYHLYNYFSFVFSILSILEVFLSRMNVTLLLPPSLLPSNLCHSIINIKIKTKNALLKNMIILMTIFHNTHF